LDQEGLGPADRGAGPPDRYAVIGNPVAHSKSPWIHARFAQQTGQKIEYGTLLCPLGEFAATVSGFRESGGRGANVTLPFKEEAFALATELSSRAKVAGAVNTLVFSAEAVRGDNTDGCGLIRDLSNNLGFGLAGKRVLLLGAGGAARGVLLPLLEENPAQLTVANRTVVKARIMAASLPEAWRNVPVICGFGDLGDESFDLVINATSAGLSDAPLPLPRDVFASGSLAYDLVYGRETAFMRAALDDGAARSSDGLGMLIEQAAESFFLWRGVRPATKAVLAALRPA
jgi:shikimate dehydrogenase